MKVLYDVTANMYRYTNLADHGIECRLLGLSPSTPAKQLEAELMRRGLWPLNKQQGRVMPKGARA